MTVKHALVLTGVILHLHVCFAFDVLHGLFGRNRSVEPVVVLP